MEKQNHLSSESCSALSMDRKTKSHYSANDPMVELWARFAGLFGSRFTSQFGETPDVTGEWRKCLAGLTRSQLERGFNELRLTGRAWPPTGPEFREICAIEPLPANMPSLDEAYKEISKYMRQGEHRRSRQDLNPFVYHTITQNLDWYSFQQLRAGETYDAFKRAYNVTVEQVKRGEEIKQIVPVSHRVEAKKDFQKTEKVERQAKQSIDSLMEMFS